jgi:toxin FitB
MIILDTNVISETTKRPPNPSVIVWLDAQPEGELWATAVTEAELRYGLARLPKGRRREELAAEINTALEVDLEGRVLPFDRAAAAAFAHIAAERRRIGRPIREFDAQIASIALVHGAAVATRDVADFSHCGIKLINPWTA